MIRNAVYFIDADSVRSHDNFAAQTIAMIGDMTYSHPSSVFISGSNNAAVSAWISALSNNNVNMKKPDFLMTKKKDDTDNVSLILAMGRHEVQGDSASMVFVISDNASVLRAAEHLSAFGLKVSAVVFDSYSMRMSLEIHKIQLSFPVLVEFESDDSLPVVPVTDPLASPAPVNTLGNEDHLSKFSQQALRQFFKDRPQKTGLSVTKAEMGGYLRSVFNVMNKDDRLNMYRLMGFDSSGVLVWAP